MNFMDLYSINKILFINFAKKKICIYQEHINWKN